MLTVPRQTDCNTARSTHNTTLTSLQVNHFTIIDQSHICQSPNLSALTLNSLPSIIPIKMSQTTTIPATCLCTSISFTVTGQPKGAVLCHCSNCKSFAGSAFGHNYRLMNATITYQKGKDRIKKYRDGNTKSGKVLERRFCGECVRLSSLVLLFPC